MDSGHSSIFRQAVLFYLFAMFLAAGTGIVSAHAPIDAGSGEGIAGATLISSPEKSYVLNTVIDEDGAPRYYRFPLKKGQILYGSLQVPGPDSPIPDLVIIGPGIEFSGSIPPSIEVPAGSGAMLVQGRPPGKPSYEPFSPQPVYESARFNVTAHVNGNYYVVVAGPGGARFSLAPGFREEFTAMEWLLIPWSVISIHLWEGQSPVMVIGPGVIVVSGGFLLAMLYRKEMLMRDPVLWFILGSGLLYLGGAAMTGLQMVHAVMRTGYSSGVLLTFIFISGPFILGIFAVRAGIRSPGPGEPMTGIGMAVTGVLGLLLWAGLLIGPLLALVASAVILVRSAGKAIRA